MLRSWFSTLVTSAVVACVTLGTNLVLSRGLGVEGRGQLASVMFVAALAAGLGQLGAGQSLVLLIRRMPGHSLRNWAYGATALAVLAGVGFSWTILHLAGGPQSRDLTMALGGATAGLLLVTALAQVDHRLRMFNWLRVGVPLSTLAGLLVVTHTGGLTPTAAVTIQLAVTIGTLSLAFVWVWHTLAVRREAATQRPRVARELLRLSVGFHGTTVLGLVVNNIDKVFLLVANNPYQFGIYASAFGISRLMTSIQDAVSATLFSRFAGSTERDNGSLSATLLAFRISFAPVLVLAGALAFQAPFIVRVILGREFHAASTPLAILLVEAVLSGAGWLLAQQFSAVGRPGLVFARQLVSLVPMLVMVWFIPQSSIADGLAVLLLVTSTLRLAVTLIMYARVFQTPFREFLPSLRDLRWVALRLNRGRVDISA